MASFGGGLSQGFNRTFTGGFGVISQAQSRRRALDQQALQASQARAADRVKQYGEILNTIVIGIDEVSSRAPTPGPVGPTGPVGSGGPTVSPQLQGLNDMLAQTLSGMGADAERAGLADPGQGGQFAQLLFQTARQQQKNEGFKAEQDAQRKLEAELKARAATDPLDIAKTEAEERLKINVQRIARQDGTVGLVGTNREGQSIFSVNLGREKQAFNLGQFRLALAMRENGLDVDIPTIQNMDPNTARAVGASLGSTSFLGQFIGNVQGNVQPGPVAGAAPEVEESGTAIGDTTSSLFGAFQSFFGGDEGTKTVTIPLEGQETQPLGAVDDVEFQAILEKAKATGSLPPEDIERLTPEQIALIQQELEGGGQ